MASTADSSLPGRRPFPSLEQLYNGTSIVYDYPPQPPVPHLDAHPDEVHRFLREFVAHLWKMNADDEFPNEVANRWNRAAVQLYTANKAGLKERFGCLVVGLLYSARTFGIQLGKLSPSYRRVFLLILPPLQLLRLII